MKNKLQTIIAAGALSAGVAAEPTYTPSNMEWVAKEKIAWNLNIMDNDIYTKIFPKSTIGFMTYSKELDTYQVFLRAMYAGEGVLEHELGHIREHREGLPFHSKYALPVSEYPPDTNLEKKLGIKQ